MRNRLPADDDLVDLYHQGLSDREIADMFGVTVQAVNKRWRKMGMSRLTPENHRVNDLIRFRWNVYYTKDSDSHHAPDASKALRVWLRRRLGDKELSQDQVAMAERWERGLRERSEVLCYVEGEGGGWYYRPRRPQDGQRVIDWPDSLNYPDRELVDLLDLPQEPATHQPA